MARTVILACRGQEELRGPTETLAPQDPPDCQDPQGPPETLGTLVPREIRGPQEHRALRESEESVEIPERTDCQGVWVLVVSLACLVTKATRDCRDKMARWGSQDLWDHVESREQ